jgi:hypothetical protein
MNQRLVMRLEPPPNAQTYAIRYARPASLRAVDGRASGFLLDIRQQVSLVQDWAVPQGGWQIETRRYAYRILDRDERELLVYHWQPGPEHSGPDFPHLHVSASLNAQVDALNRRSIDLDKLHIVTGLVSLQSFIRMLITEFQVRPLRQDWEQRLDDAATH